VLEMLTGWVASARPTLSATGAVRRPLALMLAIATVMLSACSDEGAPMQTVDNVDLDRFMGDWYVVAGIVTSMEQDAYNPVETYERVGPKKIAMTFTFRDGSFDGKEKTFHPKGFIRNTETNAEWGMQFIWPFKADYRIIYLNDDYSVTVIGRSKRDYVWIMSREPSIPDDEYDAIIAFLGEIGYDTADIRQMPHEWESA
jgi:apolipoprotein D and lipocalin family protein